MKKRLLSTFLALSLLLGLIPITVQAAGSTHPFTDVKDTDWYGSAVQYVYKNGMMSGTGNTTFSPNVTTTRGMIVTILHRMENTPSAAGTAFTDVPRGQWYTDAVAWASANGIVSGYGEGKFGPNDTITREQMAAILYRYADYKGYDTATSGSVSSFSDSGQISSYAVNAMSWAVGTGLISGMGDNTLAPKGSATRAQAAVILMRFCMSYESNDNDNNEETKRYSNGDRVFVPSEDNMLFDKSESVIYYNNLLITYTFSNLSESEASALAAIVDGEIVGKVSGAINVLQIKVSETSLRALESKADALMADERVMFAGYEYPMEFSSSEADSNPWSENSNRPDTDRGNENSPGGNDWWAEAIGAYSAWEYSSKANPIKVGIIDSGFQTNHPDLEGKISFLPQYSVNTEEDHGTHVAGLIVANNNSIGIRGVADTASLVCADWSPSKKVNYLTSGEYIEIIKQMIENDVKVINNSWGFHYYSEAGFLFNLYWDEVGYFNELTSISIRLRDDRNGTGFDKEYTFTSINDVSFYINQSNVSYDKFRKEVEDGSIIRLVTEESDVTGDIIVTKICLIEDNYGYTREQIAVKMTGAYKSYVEYMNVLSKRTALESVTIMLQLLLNGHEDFLIVQAAGNGYDNAGPGVNTEKTGFYCAINESIYNTLSQSARDRLSRQGISYNSIADRKVIVGAAKNVRNSAGNYQMTNFSDYGDNVDICAPGEDVYSTVTNSGYRMMPGTSMAAPIVSGSLAYCWSLNPNLSAPEVKDILLSNTSCSAYGVGSGASYTYPMVNVNLAAVAALGINNARINYYEVFNETMSWNEARAYCESLGGHLATITSQAEQDTVANLVKSGSRNDYWLGGTDEAEEGKWTWITGETWGYSNWGNAQPDNHSDINGSVENYLTIVKSSGKWNDLQLNGDPTSSGVPGFVCEWDTKAAYQSYLSSKEQQQNNSGYANSYKEVLKQYPEYTEQPWGVNMYAGYLLYDIDKNGIPELIVKHSDDIYYTIYTYDGQNSIKCGEITDSSFGSYAELFEYDGNGIVIHSGGIGSLRVEDLYVQNLIDNEITGWTYIASTEDMSFSELYSLIDAYTPLNNFYRINDFTPFVE